MYLCISIFYFDMIQRIQSAYLVLAALVSLGLIFVFPLWITAEGIERFISYLFANSENLFVNNNLIFKAIASLFMISGLLSFISIFLFKNRKNQFVINRLNILINLILLGLLIYRLLMVSGETQVSEKGIGSALPILVIVLLVLANKAIKKDEDLVKSVDRLR